MIGIEVGMCPFAITKQWGRERISGEDRQNIYEIASPEVGRKIQDADGSDVWSLIDTVEPISQDRSI